MFIYELSSLFLVSVIRKVEKESLFVLVFVLYLINFILKLGIYVKISFES